MGQDGLGFPERMWVDPEEDGLNGNEHLNWSEESQWKAEKQRDNKIFRYFKVTIQRKNEL
jgi:hypothetical protein